MKRILLILILIIFVANINLKAQSIYIYLNNGNISEYPLSTVDKITFSGSSMLL